MTDSLWNLKSKLYRLLRTRFPANLILKAENRQLEFMLSSLDLTGKTVIDLGTGAGNALQFLTEAGLIIAIDFSNAMLQMVRQSDSDVRLVQADAMALPIASHRVELVTAIGLSEYLWNVAVLFDEVARILKHKGWVILTFSPPGVWSRLRLILGHRIYPRTLDDLVSIARRKGFHLVEHRYSLMQGQTVFQKI